MELIAITKLNASPGEGMFKDSIRKIGSHNVSGHFAYDIWAGDMDLKDEFEPTFAELFGDSLINVVNLSSGVSKCG